MIQAKYTAEAWSAMSQKPEDRTIAINKLLSALEGRLLHIYFAYGDFDVMVIFEMPDAIAAHSTFIAAFAAGHISDVKMTQLLTGQEAMAAMQKAGELTYDRPKR